MGTSIVILSYNNLNYTKLCIESIIKYTSNEDYEIIVIDNNSNEETKNYLKSLTNIKLQLNVENRGFPGGCNDGIALAKKDNDILLLNNDIVVTSNWLSNLRRALYSSYDIGIVDPVTNSSSYWQSIATNYTNLAEMQEFALNFNVSNSTLWEQRVKLIGYCMLIKRCVINEIGCLDEIFFPGNFEDDDFCVRSTLAGYKHLLCRDTFVHHFGSSSFSANSSYAKILNDNSIKFNNKWNFTDDAALLFNTTYLSFIPNENNITVLDVYSGAGVNGCMLKFHIPHINYYISETTDNEYKLSSKLHKIYDENTNKISFDYIIINNIHRFINDSFVKPSVYKSLNYTKNIVIYLNVNNLSNFNSSNRNELGDFLHYILSTLNFKQKATFNHENFGVFLFSK